MTTPAPTPAPNPAATPAAAATRAAWARRAGSVTSAASAARAALLLVGLLAGSAAWVQSTPAGLWKTIDDSTGKERSLVRITEAGGVFTGRIEKSLAPQADTQTTCVRCTDDRKDKPLIGMVLIRNMRAAADEPGLYEGGDIVDPDNGKVYRLTLRPQDGGRTLQVRGHIGPFYRTQTWQRVE